MIVLRESVFDADVSKFSEVVRFEETTARIAMDQRTQLIDAWQGGFDSMHLHKYLRMLLLSGQL